MLIQQKLVIVTGLTVCFLHTSLLKLAQCSSVCAGDVQQQQHRTKTWTDYHGKHRQDFHLCHAAHLLVQLRMCPPACARYKQQTYKNTPPWCYSTGNLQLFLCRQEIIHFVLSKRQSCGVSCEFHCKSNSTKKQTICFYQCQKRIFFFSSEVELLLELF